jgi:hypothetical protein
VRPSERGRAQKLCRFPLRLSIFRVAPRPNLRSELFENGKEVVCESQDFFSKMLRLFSGIFLRGQHGAAVKTT